MRLLTCRTMQVMKKIFMEAFKDTTKVNMVDILQMPDYKKFLAPHLNTSASRIFKEEWTQLQVVILIFDNECSFIFFYCATPGYHDCFTSWIGMLYDIQGL